MVITSVETDVSFLGAKGAMPEMQPSRKGGVVASLAPLTGTVGGGAARAWSWRGRVGGRGPAWVGQSICSLLLVQPGMPRVPPSQTLHIPDRGGASSKAQSRELQGHAPWGGQWRASLGPFSYFYTCLATWPALEGYSLSSLGLGRSQRCPCPL